MKHTTVTYTNTCAIEVIYDQLMPCIITSGFHHQLQKMSLFYDHMIFTMHLCLN